MELYSGSYSREGNDAWLEDYVYIHNDYPDGLHLIHKQRWRGWGGNIEDDYKIKLDINDLEKSQKIIDEYLDENSLNSTYTIDNREVKEGVFIDIKQIVEDELS